MRTRYHPGHARRPGPAPDVPRGSGPRGGSDRGPEHAGGAPGGADASASASAIPGGPGTTPTGTPGPDPAASGPPGSAGPRGDAVSWRRVNLGFVSAYVLFRGGEAAIVDTGVAGSANAIESALTGVGLTWDSVGYVILTHRHADHTGSVDDVLGRAVGATGYAGAAELAAISATRDLVPVEDGDDVFGLRIIGTPGHTEGHVSALDPVGGILIAGDALNIVDGMVTGANPRFSSDMAVANASVAKLAALSFETLLVGHGNPIESGASALVAALAAGG